MFIWGIHISMKSLDIRETEVCMLFRIEEKVRQFTER